MGAAAGPAAGVTSLAGVGLSAYGQYAKGQGDQAGAEFKAAQLDRAAKYGKLKASQTGAFLTEQLNTTLGNIAAVRSAARTDPTSPTGIAIRDSQTYTAGREKATALENILGQAAEDEASASYMRQAGAHALTMGKIGAFSTLLKGASSMFSGMGGGGGGGDLGYVEGLGNFKRGT